jgi:hypothetical protein
LGGAVLAALLYVALTYQSPWQFLFVLSWPLLWRNGTAVARTHDPLLLNPMLKQLSLSTFGVGLAFVFTFGAWATRCLRIYYKGTKKQRNKESLCFLRPFVTLYVRLCPAKSSSIKTAVCVRYR